MRHPVTPRPILAGLALACGLLANALAAAPGQPVAPVHPVTDTYFGTPVVDNYRYMEDLANPEVTTWMKAQSDYTRGQLDALPGRKALLERIHSLSNSDLQRGGITRRGNRLFYMVVQPGAPLPKLYWRDGAKGEEHLLIDPGAMGKGTSTHYALDFFEPSWDGKRIAYGLSTGGSENSVLHVMDVASGRVSAEAIDRTSNSHISWRPDNQSFFYLRYLKPGPDVPENQTRYNGRTYLHTLGAHVDGEGDAVVFGRGVSAGLDVPEGEGTWLETSPDSRWALAIANHNMDDNPSTVYVARLADVKGAATPWKKIADAGDGVTEFMLHGDTLYLVSQKDAPRFRLLSLPLAHPDLAKATVVIPQGDGVLTGVRIAKDGLYTRTRDGAVSHLHRVSFDGRHSDPVPTPFEGNVSTLVADAGQPGALFTVLGWLQSAHTMAYDPVTGRSVDTGLNPPSSIDASAFTSEEVLATGDDGTRVPLSILHRKDMVADGSHPTILIGYGSYGISLEPRYSPTMLAWLERGGVIAIAHLRGGGEIRRGLAPGRLQADQDQHGARLHRLRRVPDRPRLHDVEAAGRPGRQRRRHHGGRRAHPTPRAVRRDPGPGGHVRPAARRDRAQRPAQHQRVRHGEDRAGVPRPLRHERLRPRARRHALPGGDFATGANDPRVAPWQMAKMAARVQAATSSGKPALLRVDYDAGHGMGSSTSQRENETADLWSFALWQMGDPAFQPAAH